jgi:uncharacterized protein (DUF362 family)
MCSPEDVVIVKEDYFNYPNPPFNPPTLYPEFVNLQIGGIDPSNKVYEMVREGFRLFGLDVENYGTSRWNPLSFLVNPGEKVFIKPNMIAEKHKYKNEWNYVITNGSFVRVIIDYLFLAMNGKGSIIIGDAPQTDSKYWEITKLMGLNEIRELYSKFNGFTIELVNLQDEYWVTKDDVYIETIPLPGDPRGSLTFDLGKNSYFSENDGKNLKYYGAHYDIDETNKAHSKGKHIYAIAKSPLIADVFINLPKLKTHKKCGITVNLKSLVGINANKNFLPHYIFGSPEKGGDQFDVINLKRNLENIFVTKVKKILLRKNRLFQFLSRKLKPYAYNVFGDTEEVIRSGNWIGNDTVWRMSLDLNRILLYGAVSGTFYNIRKRYFSIVDGIISMEGNGPVAGEPKNTGIIIMGIDPAAVDAVSAKLMGFNIDKLKIVSQAFVNNQFSISQTNFDEIRCISNHTAWNKMFKEFSKEDSLHFKPHFGWKELTLD